MSFVNNFDEQIDRVSESRQKVEEVRSRLIEGVLKLNSVKKQYINKQRQLTESEIEISKLRAANKNLKMSMLHALMEKEELLTKKVALQTNVERLRNQVEALEEETDEVLRYGDLNSLCQRYSINSQVSLLNKIQDAKIKLLELGFSPTFFAK